MNNNNKVQVPRIVYVIYYVGLNYKLLTKKLQQNLTQSSVIPEAFSREAKPKMKPKSFWLGRKK